MPSNYASAAEVAKKEAQIPQALDMLDKAIEEAEQSFATLVQQCQPVQRAMPPDGSKDQQAKIAEALCPLAERIRRASDRVFGLSYIITGLRSRIEL